MTSCRDAKTIGIALPQIHVVDDKTVTFENPYQMTLHISSNSTPLSSIAPAHAAKCNARRDARID